jgi:hypothetical protein
MHSLPQQQAPTKRAKPAHKRRWGRHPLDPAQPAEVAPPGPLSRPLIRQRVSQRKLE